MLPILKSLEFGRNKTYSNLDWEVINGIRERLLVCLVTIALLLAAGLYDTHFRAIGELSQFVLTLPMGKRRMLEPLASV